MTEQEITVTLTIHEAHAVSIIMQDYLDGEMAHIDFAKEKISVAEKVRQAVISETDRRFGQPHYGHEKEKTGD